MDNLDYGIIDLLRLNARAGYGDIGEVVPKGFENPVRLYEVRWQEQESAQ